MCEKKIKVKIINEYLNKNGCIIDSRMWVFCKSDRAK